MTTHDLLRRTPFRLAASFTVLFTATVVILFAILYLSVGAELESRIRARITATSEALAAIDRDRGYADLSAVVASESDSVRDADAIFLLVGPEGAFEAGNVREIPAADGWLTISRDAIPYASDRGEPDDRFFAFWRPVSHGRLLVGSSDREIRHTRELLVRGLAWSLAATILLAGLSGMLLAHRAQRRINALARTLSAISMGEFGARVPLTTSADDIDDVARQINRTLDHLQRLIENVNQASSDIAHDLKLPIGRLSQSLDRVRRTGRSVEDYRSAIETAQSEIDGILETFEALLRIAQIEGGARKARFREVDLRDVLQEVRDVYEPVAEDAGFRLAAPPPPEAPSLIRGDFDLLVQMLANLIENAICHCPKGTRITLALHDTPEGYLIAVSDNGPGIPKAEREKVFRRLYRVERARSTPGSGLGLSLVRAIAELHEASVSLAGNEPGLKVMLQFPRHP